MKRLYSYLFEKIVCTINSSTEFGISEAIIGILDIAGFGKRKRRENQRKPAYSLQDLGKIFVIYVYDNNLFRMFDVQCLQSILHKLHQREDAEFFHSDSDTRREALV